MFCPPTEQALPLARIPKKMYLCHSDLTTVPDKVMDSIHRFSGSSSGPEEEEEEGPDPLELRLFSDKDCHRFMHVYFGSAEAAVYRSIKLGAHKADLWRYRVLCLYGGLYFDIKTDFAEGKWDRYFDLGPARRWYTVYPTGQTYLMNCVVVAPAVCPVLQRAGDYIVANPHPSSYTDYITNMYEDVRALTGSALGPGNNSQADGWVCTLFREQLLDCSVQECPLAPDRYNFNCTIFDQFDRMFARTRYHDFPWA